MEDLIRASLCLRKWHTARLLLAKKGKGAGALQKTGGRGRWRAGAQRLRAGRREGEAGRGSHAQPIEPIEPMPLGDGGRLLAGRPAT